MPKNIGIGFILVSLVFMGGSGLTPNRWDQFIAKVYKDQLASFRIIRKQKGQPHKR